jgi:hypothetical protein
MHESALPRRWRRVSGPRPGPGAFGVAVVVAGAAVAACGSGSPHAQGPVKLSAQQAAAYAKSQFSAADRQAAKVLSPRSGSFLAGKATVSIVGSTTPPDGDTVPAGIWPVTTTIGSVTAGDVLVDNAADAAGHLGTGTSIVDVHPDGRVGVFATVPRTLSGCPGGVGLTTALVQLDTGWVIVGSLPTTNGKIAGAGCLVVLSSTGAVAGTISGSYLDGPWAETVRDSGATASLFVSNTLVGTNGSATAAVDRGDVVRLSLSQSTTNRPTVTAERRVASGFPEQTNATTLVRGPSGLALSASGALFVADDVGNRIVSIPDALVGPGSSGTGATLSRGGQIADPVGLAVAPNGDLLSTNGGNGKIVEITASGRQVGDYYADQDVDQDPPGADELAGIAVDQAGTGVLFVKDEAGTLDRLHS